MNPHTTMPLPPKQGSCQLPLKTLPILQQALETFRKDLPKLMETHYRQWVAYHGDRCIGFGRSQRELYQECLQREGLQPDELLVSRVGQEPPSTIDPEDYATV